jgi:membrane fusion protein, multidrug efflux system
MSTPPQSLDVPEDGVPENQSPVPEDGVPENQSPEPERPPSARPRAAPERRLRVPLIIAGGVALVLAAGALMLRRAAGETNSIALASQPKGVTVVEAKAADYRPSRRYVATIDPWLRANIGPQLVSSYVDTVLVRPGDAVKRGDVIATLNCRSASAQSRNIAMRARSLEARQAALAKQSARVAGLLDGGFVSKNEVEQRQAETLSMEAQLLATKAELVGSTLQVDDCVLRSPFDGEVAERSSDPGAFVRPGQSVASIIDRSTVRLSADIPEEDFDFVRPGIVVRAKLIATGAQIEGKVSRRAPSADASTRTVHFEIDLADPERRIPVGTTAELIVDVGAPVAATRIPLTAGSVRSGKASVYVVSDGVARLTIVKVKGEQEGQLYVDTALSPGSLVVTEGRALLTDGDRVAASKAEAPLPAAMPGAPAGSASAVAASASAVATSASAASTSTTAMPASTTAPRTAP